MPLQIFPILFRLYVERMSLTLYPSHFISCIARMLLLYPEISLRISWWTPILLRVRTFQVPTYSVTALVAIESVRFEVAVLVARQKGIARRDCRAPLVGKNIASHSLRPSLALSSRHCGEVTVRFCLLIWFVHIHHHHQPVFSLGLSYLSNSRNPGFVLISLKSSGAFDYAFASSDASSVTFSFTTIDRLFELDLSHPNGKWAAHRYPLSWILSVAR